jgi:hypothetical protein
MLERSVRTVWWPRDGLASHPKRATKVRKVSVDAVSDKGPSRALVSQGRSRRLAR